MKMLYLVTYTMADFDPESQLIQESHVVRTKAVYAEDKDKAKEKFSKWIKASSHRFEVMTDHHIEEPLE